MTRAPLWRPDCDWSFVFRNLIWKLAPKSYDFFPSKLYQFFPSFLFFFPQTKCSAEHLVPGLGSLLFHRASGRGSGKLPSTPFQAPPECLPLMA